MDKGTMKDKEGKRPNKWWVNHGLLNRGNSRLLTNYSYEFKLLCYIFQLFDGERRTEK